MSKPTKEEIKKAIQTIIDAGRDCYIEEVKASISDGKCFGMGVSKVIDDPNYMFEAAAEHAEDWNYHPEAKIIRGLLS